MSAPQNDDMNPFQIPDDESSPSKPSEAIQASATSSHSSLHNGSEAAHASSSNRVDEDDNDQGWAGSSSRAQMDAADAGKSAANTSSPSSINRATFASPPSVIEIVDAQKSGDGGSSFIVYVIRNGSTEAKRRYSEFEALREALIRLHPTIIIAPIPSKHTLSDYAAKQSKAKEDATIIARRKRMLQSFLRRCDNHPKLRGDEVLQKFLDGRYHWNDITASPPLVHLPKNNLRAPVQNPADPHASPAYAHLPLPSSVTSLRQPNQRFIDSEAFTNRFANHLSGSMEKVNRRLMRRWTEASTDYAELGAILNGFSLTESGQLATAIERTGQAADAAYIATGQMLKQWEEKFTEPLHEYTQFAAILQKLLKWRHLKHLQYELAQDALEAKKTQLEELERVENEAKRLEEALERGGAGLLNSGGRATGGGIDANGIRDGVGSGFRPSASVYGRASGEQGESASSTHPKGNGEASGNNNTADVNGSSASTRSRATSPPSSPSKRSSSRSAGYGLLGAITHTFQSVMDVDRDASRRSNISKLREEISLLEEGLSLTSNDLHYATTAIQADLDRFQRQKVSDFKDMMLDFAKMHREFAQANLDNWKEAKQEIDAVEKPAGMPESSLARRDREGVSTPGAGPRRRS
ncbi:related to SNX41 - sorting nexin, mediate distinct retrieval pathways from endosomes [Ustilago trichophora]|uniref:Related to SNX41 - sorting nexin, mediate distinct retrieval pathways from endosomes n=1 Tax=Ustilago trichophora TaxID=86804 RepID=A0A5C3EMS9_9BASI|nr:related to SNX41 - sorting nexin, mediate distinct retrieval pathways from endosomes [Ustilago trichophora]